MTTVFFLRHGPTVENGEGRIQGQQPGTLLLRETEQYIAAVVPLLRPKSPDVLISSDLERAVKTRQILKKFLQMPDIQENTTPLLREKAMGFYEGMLWKDVPPEFQAQRNQDRFDFRKFGGENDQDVSGRVVYASRMLAQRYLNQKVCCVTHAGWLKQLVLLANKTGIIADGWTNRTAIYEAGLGPMGQLQYFHPTAIKATLPKSED